MGKPDYDVTNTKIWLIFGKVDGWSKFIIGRDGLLKICDERSGWLAEAVCSSFKHRNPPSFPSHLDKERWWGDWGVGRGEEIEGSKGVGGIVSTAIVVVVVIILSLSLLLSRLCCWFWCCCLRFLSSQSAWWSIRWRREGWMVPQHLRGTARVGLSSTTVRTIHSYSLVASIFFYIVISWSIFICKTCHLFLALCVLLMLWQAILSFHSFQDFSVTLYKINAT